MDIADVACLGTPGQSYFDVFYCMSAGVSGWELFSFSWI